MAPTRDVAQLAIIREAGALNEFPYRGRNLYLLSSAVFGRLSPQQLQQLNVRDDYNLIRLRDRFFDTTVPQPEVPEDLRLAPRLGHQLHLIQFVGPVQDDWIATLRQVEGLQVVTYIPENAYLVWADQSVRDELAAQASFQPHAQWEGPFHPAYKLHPGFDADYDGNVTATIQLFTHPDVEESIATIREKASNVLKEPRQVGAYTNITVEVPASELKGIARLEDVVNVEPYTPDFLGGERQGQILAGNLNATGTGPGGPGYLAWLTSLGFSANFDFAVDITDDGFDQGETGAANVHPVFLDAGGASRVVYVRRVVGTTITNTNDENSGGHGTINASIVGGFADVPITDPGFAYEGDADGYRYGLGIAPYVRLGGTRRLFGWSPPPDYTTVIDAAYADGARISNNSWGGGYTGTYDPVSQEYDELVRDGRPAAAPSGGLDGNQEMVIVFSAGNKGPGASTLGNGATAKNTITVGASENFNTTGDADGCNAVTPWPCCDADDVDDVREIAVYSSRGPTSDGRAKPDIVAPGTQVFGAASQDGSFDGNSVCGGPTNDAAAPPGDAYYPDDPDPTDTQDQDLYTWSSGTSHAAPAVAGGAALLRQWFLDQGHPPPSPAMTKAYLLNTATYMTGPGDDLPSDSQGMGRMNLGMAFDDTPRLLFDQVKTAHTNGTVDASEVFTVMGQVADPTRPFRVTMAYTDAPGDPVTGVIRRNNLDLEVQIGGNFYRGNDFTQATSNAGAAADPPDDANNVESVFLLAGQTGNFTVIVRPTDINRDGVPNNGDPDDQDFALVIYNAEFPARNPVDIILVLDVSGSMNSTAPGGTTEKIELLKDAVELFIRTWEPFSIPADSMGIVYFSSNIAGTFPPGPQTLVRFQANAFNLITDVRKQQAGGCTALGGGILTAVRGFDTQPNRQRHVVVFTNGMQNRSPMVKPVAAGTAHQILDDPAASCGTSTIAAQAGDNLATYDVKAIHTIGTGVSGAPWTDLITAIASETDGTNHFTTTPDENLEDYFLETLVAALREDPVEKVRTVAGTLTNRDIGKTETFEINATARRATFVVSWRGERRDTAVDYALIAPDSTTVSPSLITFRDGKFYRIATLDFPLGPPDSAIGHAGTWRLVFQPQLRVNQVTYRAHLIVDDADLRYYFDTPTAGTAVGEPIPLSLWVQQGNRTLTGLQNVTASIARPPVGFGTFMVSHPVSKTQLDRPIDLSGDQFTNLAGKKGFILLQDAALRRELEPVRETIQLFDDGRLEHGDAKANDGVYSALYTNTRRPGFYDVDLSFRTAGAGAAFRTDSRTLSVGMEQFDMAKSTIDVREVLDPEGGVAFEVYVILIDQYDNYLGPGCDVVAVVAPPGRKWGEVGRRLRLNDNLDGSYSGRVSLTQGEIDAGAGVRIDVGGRSVALVPLQPRVRGFVLSVHGGVTQPLGNFNNALNPGVLAEVDVGYRLLPRIWLEAVGGRYHFDPGYEIWGGTLYLKGYVPLSRFLLYGAAGPGVYKPENVAAAFGVSVGAGLAWPFTPSLSGEVGASFFHLFSQGDDIDFLGYKVGIRFRP